MMKSLHDLHACAGRGVLAAALVALGAACHGSERNADAGGAGDDGSAVTATVPSDAGRSDSVESPSPAVGDSSASGRAPRGAGASSARTSPTPAATTPTAASSSERSARRVVVEGVDLTGVGYDRGSVSAPVVVVNFSDFGCPFCGSFARQTEPEIEKEYVQTGKVFFKYVPFVMGMFPNGEEAARASECAADQGGFWRMHDALYAGQAEWKKARDPSAAFQRYAGRIGLDGPRFVKCYAVPEVNPRTMRADVAAGKLGVRVTPSFVVNGKAVEGALPLPQFRRLLDAALEEAH